MSENNKYDFIKAFCLDFKGAKYDNKAKWEAGRYTIGEKMFAMHCSDKTGRPILTVKLQPVNGEFYRKEYQEVIAGYHMNKVHWNSVYLDSSFPVDILKDMISESYKLVLSSFSKKKQKELIGD